MIKHAFTALALSAACAAAVPSVAQAQGRRVHHEQHTCNNRVVPGHWETQKTRVRVPGKTVYKTRQVRVPGYYRTVNKEVRIPARYETRRERVWVPEQWVRDRSRRRSVSVEAGPVRFRIKGKRRRGYRCVPGHWKTVERRVLIPARCETRPVKQWVPETCRTERYPVRTRDRFEVRTNRVWVPAKVETCCERPQRRRVRKPRRARNNCEPRREVREVRRERYRSHRRSRDRGRSFTLEFDPFR